MFHNAWWVEGMGVDARYHQYLRRAHFDRFIDGIGHMQCRGLHGFPLGTREAVQKSTTGSELQALEPEAGSSKLAPPIIVSVDLAGHFDA